MDSWKAEVQEYLRAGIRKLGKGSSGENGVIASPADTWNNRVDVRSGSKIIKAYYRGRIPKVGEEVVLLKTGSFSTVISINDPVAIPSSTGGGINLPTGVPNSTYIHDIGGWGHSYLDTLGASDAGSGHQLGNRIFGALGLSWPHARNYGVGGSRITGDWRYIMRTARPIRDNWGDTSYQNKFGVQFFCYGANDIGTHTNPLFEGSRFLNDFASCNRGVFAWFRSGAIYHPQWIWGGGSAGDLLADGHYDGDLLYPQAKTGVTYSAGWAETTNYDYAVIGRAGYVTNTSGATFDVRLPPNFPGTPVTLYFAAAVGQTGSTNGTITHGGTLPISPIPLVTNNRVRAISTYENEVPITSLHTVRISGIPKGDFVTSQTITVNAGTLAAGHGLVFLGWAIEAVFPPLLVPGNIPPAGSWGGFYYNSAGIAGNGNGTAVDSAGIVATWAGYPQPNAQQPVPTTLVGSVSSGATSITVAAALPSFVRLPFLVTIPRPAAMPASTPSETMTVVSVAGTTWTVTRGLGATAHDSGQSVTLSAGDRNGPQDADGWGRISYNPTLDAVAAEFLPVGSVSVADLATAADGSLHPELYSPNDLGGFDPLHPNGMGKAAMTVAYLTAINRTPLDPRHLLAPWDANEQAEAYRMFAET